ncbi:hypothetical protein NIES4071_92170 [Calothrix sp. NIES-4071]|nr:hypothetical protein NIES4071_92170 [Calothrix sp. NIES-4071]BAZ63484.1 hypothetical protein NIES4105_92100 [Calothrix sp. NIES-4105]
MINNNFTKSISKFLVPVLLSSSLIAVSTQSARADRRNFTVVNKTGYSITRLFVSKSNTQDWEEDILGRHVLDSGEATDVSFSGFSAGECHFDIRAEFDDGEVAEGYKVNLCETDTYTFTER